MTETDFQAAQTRRFRRVDVIDPLRGIAAMAVAWFHFTHGAPRFLPDGWLKSTGTYGWMGVEIFFVISGFVLPFSMYAGGYHLTQHWFTFFKKRLTRLEPPYLLSILLVLALLFLSSHTPGFAGQSPRLRLPDLLAHVAYLNAFTGGDWVNPVYWTLAVEFQFYLTISLAFPVLVHKNRRLGMAVLLLLAALSLTTKNTSLLPLYLDLFAIGIATFQFYVGRWTGRQYALFLIALSAIAVTAHGALITIVALSTALVIAFVKWRPPIWFVKLGAVSYSLYLLHVPIGGRVINLGVRVPYSVFWRITFLLAAVLASLTASLVFHRWVELPAQRWSASIRYRHDRTPAAAEPSIPLLPGSPEAEPSL